MDIKYHKWVYLVIIFKVVITVLGAVILRVGIDAHYQSSWLTHVSNEKLNISEKEGYIILDNSAIKPYQLCQFNNLAVNWGWTSSKVETCPSLAMEAYFVVVMIVAFVISFVGLLLLCSKTVHVDMYMWQVVEVVYHGIFSLLLFVAGIAYVESANEILTFSKHDYPDDEQLVVDLKTQSKISSGGFTIIQSLLYVIMTGLVGYRLKFRYHSSLATII